MEKKKFFFFFLPNILCSCVLIFRLDLCLKSLLSVFLCFYAKIYSGFSVLIFGVENLECLRSCVFMLKFTVVSVF